MEDSLDMKISKAIGKHYKQHNSIIDDSRNNRFVFSRPNQRGFFTINHLVPQNRREKFDIYDQGIYIGRMDYESFLRKFSGRI